jgi:hypothetical protein
MIVFALIYAILASQPVEQQQAAEPDVAAEYYGVDEVRELSTSGFTSGYTSATSAKHRTATANARLNRTWLYRNYSTRIMNNSRRSRNFSTFGRGKSPFSSYFPYRPLLGSHRFNHSLLSGLQRSAEHMSELAAMKKKSAVGLSGESGKWNSHSSLDVVSRTPTGPCCEQEVAECLACRVHVPVVIYCRRNPTSPGCVEVRQRSTPKTKSGLPLTAAP